MALRTIGVCLAVLWIAPTAVRAADVCGEFEARSAMMTEKALGTMSAPVFGLSPWEWGEQHLSTAIANVAHCVSAGRLTAFEGEEWRNRLWAGSQRSIPLAQDAASIRLAHSESWPGASIPTCSGLLSWRSDKRTLSDNAPSILGSEWSVLAVDGEAVAAFALDCTAVLSRALDMRGVPAGDAELITADIAASALAEAAELRVRNGGAMILPTVEGRAVPRAYLSQPSLAMVEKAERLSAAGGTVTPEDALLFMNWADGVVSEDVHGAEKAYAGAVTDLVRRSFVD